MPREATRITIRDRVLSLGSFGFPSVSREPQGAVPGIDHLDSRLTDSHARQGFGLAGRMTGRRITSRLKFGAAGAALVGCLCVVSAGQAQAATPDGVASIGSA